jgi:hypothetical protein
MRCGHACQRRSTRVVVVVVVVVELGRDVEGSIVHPSPRGEVTKNKAWEAAASHFSYASYGEVALEGPWLLSLACGSAAAGAIMGQAGEGNGVLRGSAFEDGRLTTVPWKPRVAGPHVSSATAKLDAKSTWSLSRSLGQDAGPSTIGSCTIGIHASNGQISRRPVEAVTSSAKGNMHRQHRWVAKQNPSLMLENGSPVKP